MGDLHNDRVNDPFFSPYLQRRLQEAGITISQENPGLTLNIERLAINNACGGASFVPIYAYSVDLDFNQSFALGKDAQGTTIVTGASSQSYGPVLGWAGALRIDNEIKSEVADQLNAFLKNWREANP